MDDATRMQIAKSLKQLTHNLPYLRFSDCVLFEVGEQLAAWYLLHHDIHPPFVLVHFFDLHDVRVGQ